MEWDRQASNLILGFEAEKNLAGTPWSVGAGLRMETSGNRFVPYGIVTRRVGLGIDTISLRLGYDSYNKQVAVQAQARKYMGNFEPWAEFNTLDKSVASTVGIDKYTESGRLYRLGVSLSKEQILNSAEVSAVLDRLYLSASSQRGAFYFNQIK